MSPGETFTPVRGSQLSSSVRACSLIAVIVRAEFPFDCLGLRSVVMLSSNISLTRFMIEIIAGFAISAYREIAPNSVSVLRNPRSLS